MFEYLVPHRHTAGLDSQILNVRVLAMMFILINNQFALTLVWLAL